MLKDTYGREKNRREKKEKLQSRAEGTLVIL